MISKQFEFKKSEYQGQLLQTDMKKFGLLQKPALAMVIEDLKKEPLNYVVAECIKKNVEFTQEGFLKQILRKGENYLMSISVYQQLWYDPYRKRKNLKPSSKKFNSFYRPYNGEDMSGKTLLVIRTGGLGDLLFIQPNLVYLKEKYPTCKIKISCGPQYHAMVENWNCIDEVYSLPLSNRIFISSDYHAIFEGVIERCKEAYTTNAYQLFTRWLNLNLPDELLIPKQTPKTNLVTQSKILLEEWGIKDFILLQMKASSPVRTPRVEFWIKIINRLIKNGHNIVLTDSPYMSSQLDDFIKNNFDNEYQKKLFNFSTHSKFISSTIALASLSKCNVATDSSLVHISESLSVPCVAFYGPFPADIRTATYKHVITMAPKVECAPCFQHGVNPCKNAKDGHPICYDSLNTDEIIKSIEKTIGWGYICG